MTQAPASTRPGPFRVRQYGPRRLFNEVSAAYQIWKDAGKPPVSALKITVTPHGQHAELTNVAAARPYRRI